MDRDNILPRIGQHYHFDQIKDDLFDGPPFNYVQTIQAQVVDMTDRMIVEAIIAAARENKVDDLYLIDKTFILEAITEKLERLKGERV